MTPNIGGFAANIACGFAEFWRCGTRFLIIFLQVFAVLSLITARDNKSGADKSVTNEFDAMCLRTFSAFVDEYCRLVVDSALTVVDRATSKNLST